MSAQTTGIESGCPRATPSFAFLTVRVSVCSPELRAVSLGSDPSVDPQQTQVRSLQVALSGIVTKYELDKLSGLTGEQPFLCFYSDGLYAELNHLKAMNHIADQDGQRPFHTPQAV
jgi:hypothetical protein